MPRLPLIVVALAAALPSAGPVRAETGAGGYQVSLSGTMVVYSANGTVASTDEWTVKVDVKSDDEWSVVPSFQGDPRLRSVREKIALRLKDSHVIISEFEPARYHAFITSDSAMLSADLACFLPWVGYVPKSLDPGEDFLSFRYGLASEFGGVLDKGAYVEFSKFSFGDAQSREFLMMLGTKDRSSPKAEESFVTTSKTAPQDLQAPQVAGHLVLEGEVVGGGYRFPEFVRYTRYRLGNDSSGQLVSTKKPMVSFTLRCLEIKVPYGMEPSEMRVVGQVFVSDKRFVGLVNSTVPYTLTNAFIVPTDNEHVKSALDRQRLEENKPTMGQLRFRNTAFFFSITFALVAFIFVWKKMNRRTENICRCKSLSVKGAPISVSGQAGEKSSVSQPFFSS